MEGIVSKENWIDNQLKGKSCTIVLIGAETANRKWIKYEIKKSWELGNQSDEGKNPFELFTIEGVISL